MSPPTCDEHGKLMNKVDYICDGVTDIKTCLRGKMEEGKSGLIAAVSDNTVFRKTKQKFNTELISMVLRIVLVIGIGFIAVKVGLK